MVNPRFIELARRLMNKEVPGERVESKQRTVESKLERDSKGKPILELTSLKKTAVNSKTQEEYDTLMQVYECGGWKWC